eukprot:682813-Hanusia_phi.AAC.1
MMPGGRAPPGPPGPPVTDSVRLRRYGTVTHESASGTRKLQLKAARLSLSGSEARRPGGPAGGVPSCRRVRYGRIGCQMMPCHDNLVDRSHPAAAAA